jgi:hypothetical protein
MAAVTRVPSTSLLSALPPEPVGLYQMKNAVSFQRRPGRSLSYFGLIADPVGEVGSRDSGKPIRSPLSVNLRASLDFYGGKRDFHPQLL